MKQGDSPDEAILLQGGGLKWEQGAEPPPGPHFNGGSFVSLLFVSVDRSLIVPGTLQTSLQGKPFGLLNRSSTVKSEHRGNLARSRPALGRSVTGRLHGTIVGPTGRSESDWFVRQVG